MDLQLFSATTLPEIEEHMQFLLRNHVQDDYEELYLMLAYHMGWENLDEPKQGSGKRIRPLMVLLSAHSAGGDWAKAIPAAAAVEYIHNFSLIHDDIQDKSEFRRGRKTLWNRWGIAQAINAGDLMFTLGHMAILDLESNLSPDVVLKASKLLHQSCVLLTQGQYLDLAYEDRDDLQLEDYLRMIGGKTAALLSCCAELGALSAAIDDVLLDKYRCFGHSLGLAFQIQDDWLGIWGDSALTGKANSSDLISGKKSLPILYGLKQKGRFASRWAEGPINPGETNELANLLINEGAQSYTEEMAKQETDRALEYLNVISSDNDRSLPLLQITRQLLDRKK